MKIEYICDKVASIKKKHSANPFIALENLDCIVLNQPLGTSSTSVKGFCSKHYGVCAVVINDDLPEIMQKIIAAHELGHVILHMDTPGVNLYNEACILDNTSVTERKANFFAAEYLIEDKDVYDAIQYEYSLSQMAAYVKVPIGLLILKLEIMRWYDDSIKEPDYYTHNDFLYDLEIPSAEQIDI